MSSHRQGDEAIASFVTSDSAIRPKFPIIYNPILFIGTMSIALWTAILAGIAYIWH